MLCNTCNKLSILNSKKTCLRCKGTIYSNIAVICDNCSKNENLCAICLKKLYNTITRQRPKSACSSCGNK